VNSCGACKTNDCRVPSLPRWVGNRGISFLCFLCTGSTGRTMAINESADPIVIGRLVRLTARAPEPPGPFFLQVGDQGWYDRGAAPDFPSGSVALAETARAVVSREMSGQQRANCC
jgi:hypothetical protein